MNCIVCKKEIDPKGEPAHLLESLEYVHSGVCYTYLNEQGLNESTENTVELLID